MQQKLYAYLLFCHIEYLKDMYSSIKIFKINNFDCFIKTISWETDF